MDKWTMGSKDDPRWFAQQLVETLQREVAQKEAELAMLLSHRAKLLMAFSTPTFPPGYAPSGSIHADNSNRLDDLSKTIPVLTADEPGPSGRCPRQKITRSPAVVIKQTTPPPPYKSSQPPLNSPSQHCRTDSEASDYSHQTVTTTKKQDRNQLNRPEIVGLDAAVRHVSPRSCDSGESSESTEGTVQPSPVNKKIRNQSNFPVVNWTQQIKRRTATSVNGDSSTDTGDSLSGGASVDEGQSKGMKVTDSGKTPKPAARPAKAATQAQTLSSDAPSEDKFDWEVLGFSGPWSPDRSSSLLADSSWSQIQKQQNSLPCIFQTMDEYRSSFEGLIFEECKAHLYSYWDMHKTTVVGTNQNISEILGIPEDRSQSSLWQFRAMYPSSDDPFKYIEAEQIEGSIIRLDPSEVVLLTHNNRKFLAVVTLTSYKGVLLRTRMELPAADGQCAVLRMANMVTLKRQYVSLCRVMEIWDPLQQQLLNPWESSNPVISASSDSYQEGLKSKSCSERLSGWRKERLFNKKQLGVVEALLRLQQGFLLVQGPPGTGKTSTIVGMYRYIREELKVDLLDPERVVMGNLCVMSAQVDALESSLDYFWARILVCASSNAAVDEIVSRLMHNMHNSDGKSYTPRRGTLVRLGVEKSIQTACLPVWLDKFVQSNSSASNFSTVRRDTIAGAFIVCCTISGSGHQIFDEVNQKFDLLIIDEAAQALESEVLIALQRVKGRCVMVGDPCQLPAVVLQRPGKAYGRSLFERMQEAGRPVFLMTTQYRMHPFISKFPSVTFYEGRLKDSLQIQSMLPFFKENTQEKGIDICGYSFKLGAYCFLDVTWGVEKGELVGHSISNVDEAEVVATVVQGVVRSLREGVEPNIGVITPYLAQRSVIMRNLETYGIDGNACEVNTVDGFQGREKDVIILSCVRAQPEHGIGFVSDVRRMNVALTRARHSLIIVGHAETLRRQSHVWNALVEDATARELYQVLRHKSKTTKMEASLKVGGGRQATTANGTPQHTNQRRVEQGGTVIRTESGLTPSHTRFEQRTYVPSGTMQQPNHKRFEQATNLVSATGHDENQGKFQHGASTATGTEQRPSHIRFEEEGDVNTGKLQPSNLVGSAQPLSVICGMAMDSSNQSSGDKSRKRDSLKRKANEGGSATGCDQAEGSEAKRGRRVDVKFEQVEHHPTRTGEKVTLPEKTNQVPAVLPLSEAPAVGRMRGQIRNSWKGSGWHNSVSLGSTTVKEEMQDEIPFRQYPPNIQGNWPVEAVYYDRDDSRSTNLSDEKRGSFPRGRGRGRHRGSGRSNYKPNRVDNVLQQNASRLGNSPGRKHTFRGLHRGRGKFSRPYPR